MKHLSYLSIMILGLLLSCSPGKDVFLRIHNPLEADRQDARILITRSAMAGLTQIPGEMLPLLKDENGKPLACQVDDVDGDGSWDELFCLTDLKAGESIKAILTFVSEDSYPVPEVRTNLRLGAADQEGYPELSSAKRLEGVAYHNYDGVTGAAYQMEGPAWENDLVGFRNYLDQRNGIDIFGKCTTDMVMDGVGVEGAPSYHETGDWGMDVLKVGTSLGAGAIGYWFNDSIYRVGDNGSGSYEVVFEGSLRSRLHLGFEDWKVEGTPVSVLHQIEITAGRRCYGAKVTFEGDKSMDLVTGIVNMKSKELEVVELDPNYVALLTHDHQAEDGSLLTMALMVPQVDLMTYGKSKDSGEGITQTYYAILDASPGDGVLYRFYSFWENEDARWKDLEAIKAYLKEDAQRLTQSVMIEVMP